MDACVCARAVVALFDKLKKNKEEEVDKRTPEQIRKDEKRARIRARIKAFERGQLLKKVKYIYIILGVIILDQVSKWYAMEHIIRPVSQGASRGGSGFFEWMFFPPPVFFAREAVQITPFFNVVLVWNTGISFGLLGNLVAYGFIILIVISLVIVAFFALWMYEAKTREMMIPYAMVIGGALGNVLDRIRFRAVVDFLDFHIGDLHFWAFNIADMGVVCGVLLIIFISQYKTIKRKKRWRRNAHKRRQKIYRFSTSGRK